MKFVSLLFSVLFFYPVFSQNLLLNGGFEEENTCTEFSIRCAPEAWISSSDGFSNYFKDAGRAYEGQHCMAVSAGHSRKNYQRTYIRSQLPCALRKGNSYRLTLYVKSAHPILESMGIMFCKTDPLLSNYWYQRTPSLYFSQGNNHFTKDSSWQKVEWIYQASGEELFIQIGSFAKLDITGPTGIKMVNQFLVFVDAISMEPINRNELACSSYSFEKKKLYEQDARHSFLKISLNKQRTKPETPVLQPTTLPVIDTLVLPDVLFATAKKELGPASHTLLDTVCANLGLKTVDSIIIEGHTDNTGTAIFNERLSQGRSETVKTYLQSCPGLHRAKLVSRAWASSKPRADNETQEGRRKNRRVELIIYCRE